MIRWEQYEVWRLNNGDWEPLGWFRDFEVARAVTRQRHSKGVRLVHSLYEDGQSVRRDVLAEIGATRQQP